MHAMHIEYANQLKSSKEQETIYHVRNEAEFRICAAILDQNKHYQNIFRHQTHRAHLVFALSMSEK